MKDWKLAMVVGVAALDGVVVGAQCFGAGPVAAQASGPYSRCIAAHQPSLDVDDHGVMQRTDDAHTVIVPTGCLVAIVAAITTTQPFPTGTHVPQSGAHVSVDARQFPEAH